MLKIAVVGAGAAGVATARFAARAGHQVTVFEQFALDHDRGSSHGPSRIIRRTYPSSLYTGLMHEAYELWDALEAEARRDLRIRTGGIYFGPADHPEVRGTLDALEAHGVAHEVLDRAAAAGRFSQFVFRDGEIAIYQDDTGILKASDCVRAQADLARHHGAEIREGARVVELRPLEGGLRVVTADGGGGAYDRVAVTAGPWTRRMLPDLELPLTVTRQQQIFIRPAARPGPSAFAVGSFPVWIDAVPSMYGFPAHPEAPGVKVALHQAGEQVDPDDVDPALSAGHVASLLGYLRDRLPDLGAGEVLGGKVCLYTMAPDHDFVLDAVPGLPGAYLASACSGHGFKFSILVGRMLLDCMEGSMRDLSGFALSRFSSKMSA